MNVLMLTHRLPYAPNRGDRTRAYHMLRYLAASYRVHLVSLVHDDEEASRVPELRDIAASVSAARCRRAEGLARGVLALAGRKPLTHALLDSRELQPVVDQVASRHPPDVVLAYGSGMARLALAPPLDNTPLVVDLVDVDSVKWRQYAAVTRLPLRWIYGREARCLGSFEARVARTAFATVVVNERERRALQVLAPKAAAAVVVPLGLDVKSFTPPRPPAKTERVVFCGVMNYRPNVEGISWFLREVWPKIRAARPAATLVIVGADPVRKLRALAQHAGGVELTGTVADVRPYLWDSSVFVAPLRIARGMQTKVLECLAAGLPGVITPAVNDGLPADIRRACVLAEDALSFASSVVELLAKTPSARRRVTEEIDFEHLAWDRQLGPFAELLEEAAASRFGQAGLRRPA
jgi:sugar transferase (PEP-CTERM/EpsH1 system associated)